MQELPPLWRDAPHWGRAPELGEGLPKHAWHSVCWHTHKGPTHKSPTHSSHLPPYALEPPIRSAYAGIRTWALRTRAPYRPTHSSHLSEVRMPVCAQKPYELEPYELERMRQPMNI